MKGRAHREAARIGEEYASIGRVRADAGFRTAHSRAPEVVRSGRLDSWRCGGKPNLKEVLEAQQRIEAKGTDTVTEDEPGRAPEEDQSRGTVALVEALAEMSNKYAEAASRAAAAEQKVEHLEGRLRETQAEMDRLRAGSDLPEVQPMTDPGEEVRGRGGPWWRERERRRRRKGL